VREICNLRMMRRELETRLGETPTYRASSQPCQVLPNDLAGTWRAMVNLTLKRLPAEVPHVAPDQPSSSVTDD